VSWQHPQVRGPGRHRTPAPGPDRARGSNLGRVDRQRVGVHHRFRRTRRPAQPARGHARVWSMSIRTNATGTPTRRGPTCALPGRGRQHRRNTTRPTASAENLRCAGTETVGHRRRATDARASRRNALRTPTAVWQMTRSPQTSGISHGALPRSRRSNARGLIRLAKACTESHDA
jgi:hypothetical protein